MGRRSSRKEVPLASHHLKEIRAMHIKVRGGTVQHGEQSLCATCKYATVVKGRSMREEIVECSQVSSGHGRIPFAVAECSEYLHRSHPSVFDMESIAWVLRTNAGRTRIGFVRARDVKPSERLLLTDDDE
jgi:hypothetical protein